jgi:two-component system response regulator YesN
MYNILITDDEQIVIDSLSFIIKKNFEGLVTIFSALSGADALNIVNSNQIDIVFMDINMPVLNGLETVNCITRSKPNTVIIMLSAFDRFQYAQEALNLGAYKYITKPVNRNLVIQTVRGAMNLVDTRRGQASDDQELHRKLDFVLPMVESDFIYSCAFNGGKNIDMTTYLDYFNIHDKAWCFCCMEVPHIDSSNQYAIYTRIRDILNEHSRCLMGSFMMNRLAVFFPQNDSAEQMNANLKELYTILSIKVVSGIRIGVSRLMSDDTQTTNAYNEALDALTHTSEKGGIYFAGLPSSQTDSSEPTGKILEQLFNRLRIGDTGGVRQLTSLYCTSLAQTDSDMNRIKNALFELLVNARNITSEIIESYKNEAFDTAFAVLSKENDITNLEQFVQKRLYECSSAITNTRTQHENPIITKVCSLIQKNLSQDISLDEIAGTAQISPFYLSKLFKEEKGITFSTYITSLRLDKAKQMLASTNDSIKEISAQIGYNDQNYFSKLFKNQFGVTPSEFRDSITLQGGN